MIKVCALASGSNGNAYFIKTGDGCFLVDVGISCKQICERLSKINQNIDDINAIFITHEHTDHIRGLDVLSKKHSIPVYMTEHTLRNASFNLNNLGNINFISSDDIIKLNNTMINSFSKSHDAADPCSFAFNYKNKKVSIMTDIGVPCRNIIKNVKDSDALFLESNYDEDLLTNGRYPIYLKRRISSNQGHLSNYDAALLVLEHASPRLSHLFLSHLSENNNTPNHALKTFSSILKERKDLNRLSINLTSRNNVSDVVSIKT